MTRRFYVRTYGCQMNEHDSERIAGVLAADGMEPTDDLDDADVVVLNTCCIRENADNKFYGAPRRPEGAEGRAARICRSRSADAWRKRTARACGNGRRSSTWCSAPTTSRTRRSCSREAQANGPVVEILDEHEAYPSALPARRDVDHAAWVTIQIGCDNTCAFCIVPSVRGKEVSRRTGDIVHEVEELARDGVVEITLLGQNVNSYGRDLGAGQFRPQFADLLRTLDAVDGHRAHPLHVAASEGPAPGDDRGDGRVRARVRAPAPAAAVGERPHARAHAPGLHRGALPRAAATRRGPRSPTSR